MKQILPYTPILLIFIIQYFDKEDNYFWLQIVILILTILYAIYHVIFKNKQH